MVKKKKTKRKGDREELIKVLKNIEKDLVFVNRNLEELATILLKMFYEIKGREKKGKK
jgi:hypothetical protein